MLFPPSLITLGVFVLVFIGGVLIGCVLQYMRYGSVFKIK